MRPHLPLSNRDKNKMQHTNIKTDVRFILMGLTVIFLTGCGDPVEKVRQGGSCQDCILTGADLPGISLEV